MAGRHTLTPWMAQDRTGNTTQDRTRPNRTKQNKTYRGQRYYWMHALAIP